MLGVLQTLKRLDLHPAIVALNDDSVEFNNPNFVSLCQRFVTKWQG